MDIIKANKNSMLLATILSALLLMNFSCGGSVQDPNPGSGYGKVALFISDNMSFYNQIVATITSVQLINSGTAEVCTVLKAPVTLDIANLTNMAHYVDLTECPAGKYNRIDIDIKKNVRLMDQLGATSSCAFTDLLNMSGVAEPLDCDPVTGICTVSIRSGVRDGRVLVQEDRYNDLGIDFDLKQFTVTNFGDPSTCSVTMAAATISAGDFNESGRAHGVTGTIADLDDDAETFSILAGGVTLTVDFSGILSSLHPEIGDVLEYAQAKGLAVNVLTGGIDLASGTIMANRIYVKAAGTVSNVVMAPQWSFLLTLEDGEKVAGSHKPPAEVQGSFLNGSWVNVKLDGYDEDNHRYLASSIEVLPLGTVLDD